MAKETLKRSKTAKARKQRNDYEEVTLTNKEKFILRRQEVYDKNNKEKQEKEKKTWKEWKIE